MEPLIEKQIIIRDRKSDQDAGQKIPIQLIGEEPLSIRIEGKPYSVIMRTPGDEIAHAAGFCLGEGIVDAVDDIAAIGFCDDMDTNVVTVTLTDRHRQAVTVQLDRREFISQTSCGICGKEVIEDLYQQIRPIEDGAPLDWLKALEVLEHISDLQPIRQKTRGCHAAAIYSADFKLLASAEDVGRHNALDKAVGKLFLENRLPEAALLILSSRISYELVQKAARARIPIILALSRPTALAVDLAQKLNMTLAGSDDGQRLNVFCNAPRL